MSTRNAPEHAALSHERYMSSPEYEELRGISGTAVAARAAILPQPELRRLVWYLQARSLEAGGLKQVARDLLTRYAARIGTPLMHQYGRKPGQVYSVHQSEKIGQELLSGTVHDPHFRNDVITFEVCADWLNGSSRKLGSVPAARFVEMLAANHDSLTAFLTNLCVNPRLTLAQPDARYTDRLRDEFQDESLRPHVAELVWFQDIIGTLLDYQRTEEAAARADFVVTAIGAKVFETLDFALKARRMVLVEGLEGRGKSEAAKAWCRLHKGEARFVNLKGITNKTMVFRTIAKALGIASSYARTATEMQARIEDVLQRSGLMLLIDEAHFTFQQSPRIYSRPEIVDWIDTALCNHDVPVALVTTPQFIKCVKQAEMQVGWNWRQFRRRVRRWVTLPQWNTDADLEAVARKLMPGISRAGSKLAVGYAKTSLVGSPSRDVSGLGDLATEALLIAEQAGRSTVIFEDLDQAINGYLIPSDTAFASAMNSAAAKPPRKRGGNAVALPLQCDFKPIETESEPLEFPARSRGLEVRRPTTEPLIEA